MLKWKSDVFGAFKRWRIIVENESCAKLKCLGYDNGDDYYSVVLLT